LTVCVCEYLQLYANLLVHSADHPSTKNMLLITCSLVDLSLGGLQGVTLHPILQKMETATTIPFCRCVVLHASLALNV